MTPLQKGIKRIIEENCKKGDYIESFSPEFQKEIKARAEEIAVLVTEDDEFMKSLDLAVEEAIRVMILR